MNIDDELRALRLENARLRNLLQEASLDSMGGIPDLFHPKMGWAEWDKRVGQALNGLGRLREVAR